MSSTDIDVTSENRVSPLASPQGDRDPVSIFGDLEGEDRGLVYGAMVFEVLPGGATELHNHASEETWMICEGAGRATVGGKEFDLAAGERTTVPPGVSHTITNTSEEILKVMAFWWRKTECD